ncbi:MAG TPA: histidine kinase [Nannocystaceae bacterium]|nr:histidine kinase [Nannocystaceae bacterium]
MRSRRSGAAIEWLLRPWLRRDRARARIGRISAVCGAIVLSVLPSMMLYYGLDGWWWDGTIAVVSMSWLGVVALDSLAQLVERRRKLPGLARVLFIVLGLALGILLGYVALFLFGWSPDRTLATVIGDYRRTMGILAPIVVLVVIVGASLWYRAEAFRLETAAARASLSALTGQMQPHVLFNALNALKELTLDDPQKASALTQRLADLYRALLYASRTPTSTLAEECAIAANYLEVEHVRFGDRLRYAIDIPPELATLELPSLVVQTLVENAVRHGIAKSRKGGEVRVSAQQRGREAVIEISNTGATLDVSEHAGAAQVGLANTRARLALLFGDAASLSLATAGERTVVRVVVPHGGAS